MKIQLLVAIAQQDYLEHLSDVLTQRYGETFEDSVCSTGEHLRELESDAYLTYVTQVGDYVVTEYISAQGQRYGLLLDGQCRTLAEMPGLCDILAGGTPNPTGRRK